ncbi:response regulator [Phototrophicus methaneseepsis]|nr:response regulator [Phototrophicus methaneseepsis]
MNYMKILLVEDDEGHATLVRMNLREAGLDNEIQHVSDGQAALDYIDHFLASKEADSLLILLDLNLPVLDGYAVLESLKQNHLTRRIPIIVLTSTDDDREINHCYELGCNVYLRKPVNYTDFVQAVKSLGLFLSVIELPDPQS